MAIENQGGSRTQQLAVLSLFFPVCILGPGDMKDIVFCALPLLVFGDDLMDKA